MKFDLSQKKTYLDQCAKCQGLWFDMGELQQLMDFALDEAVASGSIHEDLDNTFATETAMLSCPRCNKETEFKKGSIMDIEVSKCTSCSGIWLDSGEVQSLIGDVTEETSEERNKVPEGTAAAGACPRCRVSLSRWGNMPESLKDLYIDFCPACMGLWFDKGEFKELFRIFSTSPFINA